MTFPKLPKRERDAIRTGPSAKHMLAVKAHANRRRKMRERVALDERTGESSDRLADTILAFCKSIRGLPPNPVLEHEFVFFLSETRNAAWHLDASGVRPLKIPKRLDLRRRFLKSRPQVQEGVHYMAYQAYWLATLLRAEAPERPIWEGAIDKAEKRSKELRVKLTIRQQLEVRQRELELLPGPPPRPRYPGGSAEAAKTGPANRIG